MADDEDITAVRRSLIAIGNALSDRVTLLRAVVDELLSGLVAKGVFTEEEIRAMTARAVEEREKHRAEYRVPDDASGPDKMAHLERELAATVVDLAAIRSLLGREKDPGPVRLAPVPLPPAAAHAILLPALLTFAAHRSQWGGPACP